MHINHHDSLRCWLYSLFSAVLVYKSFISVEKSQFCWQFVKNPGAYSRLLFSSGLPSSVHIYLFQLNCWVLFYMDSKSKSKWWGRTSGEAKSDPNWLSNLLGTWHVLEGWAMNFHNSSKNILPRWTCELWPQFLQLEQGFIELSVLVFSCTNGARTRL